MRDHSWMTGVLALLWVYPHLCWARGISAVSSTETSFKGTPSVSELHEYTSQPVFQHQEGVLHPKPPLSEKRLSLSKVPSNMRVQLFDTFLKVSKVIDQGTNFVYANVPAVGEVYEENVHEPYKQQVLLVQPSSHQEYLGNSKKDHLPSKQDIPNLSRSGVEYMEGKNNQYFRKVISGSDKQDIYHGNPQEYEVTPSNKVGKSISGFNLPLPGESGRTNGRITDIIGQKKRKKRSIPAVFNTIFGTNDVFLNPLKKVSKSVEEGRFANDRPVYFGQPKMNILYNGSPTYLQGQSFTGYGPNVPQEGSIHSVRFIRPVESSAQSSSKSEIRPTYLKSDSMPTQTYSSSGVSGHQSKLISKSSYSPRISGIESLPIVSNSHVSHSSSTNNGRKVFIDQITSNKMSKILNISSSNSISASGSLPASSDTSATEFYSGPVPTGSENLNSVVPKASPESSSGKSNSEQQTVDKETLEIPDFNPDQFSYVEDMMKEIFKTDNFPASKSFIPETVPFNDKGSSPITPNPHIPTVENSLSINTLSSVQQTIPEFISSENKEIIKDMMDNIFNIDEKSYTNKIIVDNKDENPFRTLLQTPQSRGILEDEETLEHFHNKIFEDDELNVGGILIPKDLESLWKKNEIDILKKTMSGLKIDSRLTDVANGLDAMIGNVFGSDLLEIDAKQINFIMNEIFSDENIDSLVGSKEEKSIESMMKEIFKVDKKDNLGHPSRSDKPFGQSRFIEIEDEVTEITSNFISRLPVSDIYSTPFVQSTQYGLKEQFQLKSSWTSPHSSPSNEVLLHSSTLLIEHNAPRNTIPEWHNTGNSFTTYPPHHFTRTHPLDHVAPTHSPDHVAPTPLPDHVAQTHSPDHVALTHSPDHVASTHSLNHVAPTHSPDHVALTHPPRHTSPTHSPNHASSTHPPDHSAPIHISDFTAPIHPEENMVLEQSFEHPEATNIPFPERLARLEGMKKLFPQKMFDEVDFSKLLNPQSHEEQMKIQEIKFLLGQTISKLKTEISSNYVQQTDAISVNEYDIKSSDLSEQEELSKHSEDSFTERLERLEVLKELFPKHVFDPVDFKKLLDPQSSDEVLKIRELKSLLGQTINQLQTQISDPHIGHSSTMVSKDITGKEEDLVDTSEAEDATDSAWTAVLETPQAQGQLDKDKPFVARELSEEELNSGQVLLPQNMAALWKGVHVSSVIPQSVTDFSPPDSGTLAGLNRGSTLATGPVENTAFNDKNIVTGGRYRLYPSLFSRIQGENDARSVQGTGALEASRKHLLDPEEHGGQPDMDKVVELAKRLSGRRIPKLLFSRGGVGPEQEFSRGGGGYEKEFFNDGASLQSQRLEAGQVDTMLDISNFPLRGQPGLYSDQPFLQQQSADSFQQQPSADFLHEQSADSFQQQQSADSIFEGQQSTGGNANVSATYHGEVVPGSEGVLAYLVEDVRNPGHQFLIPATVLDVKP